MVSFSISSNLGQQGQVAQISLRFLVTLMAILSLVTHTWLDNSVFPKVMPHFQMALGDLAPSKLPQVTQFVLWFHGSYYWTASLWITHIAFPMIWLLRSAYWVGIIGTALLLWVVTVPALTFFSLWAGDMMIVKALASAAKAKGLMP